jgi:hypothetical protein
MDHSSPAEGMLDIDILMSTFLSGLEAILSDKLFGLYIYGAAVFPETKYTGDIDFHVILKGRLTDEEQDEIDELHRRLAHDFQPLGEELDGYYILLDDAHKENPPQSQMWNGAVDNAWALHREHIRAGKCWTLYGPDPKELYPAASWIELRKALQNELDYVRRHLEIYPAYCALNLCRLMYSFDSRDVVISKTAAAEWAERLFPEWIPIIDCARRAYMKRSTGANQQLLADRISDLYLFSIQQIQESDV